MDRNSWSEYEKYLIMADDSGKLSQTYSAFVEFKEVVSILKRISVSAEKQYSYNGKFYDNPFSSERAKQALSNIDRGIYDRAIYEIASKTKLFVY